MLMFRQREKYIQALKSGEQFRIDNARFGNYYVLDCHLSDEYYLMVNGIHGWPIAVVRPETMTIDQPFFLLEVNFNGCAIYMRIYYSQITLSSDVAYDGKEVRNE